MLRLFSKNYPQHGEEIGHPNTFGRQRTIIAGKNQWTIVTSKNYRIVEVRETISPSPTLSLQGDVGMGGPHSLLAMYVSVERQTPRPYLVSRKIPPKINTW